MIKYICAFVLLLPFNLRGNEISGKVVKVIDGNTIEVFTEDKETLRILLSEVDCPEPGQDFADEAKNLTEKLLLKKKVTLQMKGKDRWGNKLAIVILKNGNNLNYELIRNGLAWAYKSEQQEIAQLELEAKNNKLGLWSSANPMAPWIYRRKQTMLAPKGR